MTPSDASIEEVFNEDEVAVVPTVSVAVVPVVEVEIVLSDVLVPVVAEETVSVDPVVAIREDKVGTNSEDGLALGKTVVSG